MANQENKQQSPENGKPSNGKGKGFSFYWIYGILAIVLLGLQFFNWGGDLKKTTWMQFEQEMLARKAVEKIVVVNREKAEIFLTKEALADTIFKDVNSKGISNSVNPGPHYYFEIGSIDNFEEKVYNAQHELFKKDTVGKSPQQIEQIKAEYKPIGVEFISRKDWGGEVLSWLFPILILVALWIFFMRMMGRSSAGGQIFNVGKSKAQLFDKNASPNVTFKDVAGLEEAKVEIMEIVDFLKNPQKYTMLGGKIPKGALLVGPPGTGKTLLAKAVAGEAKVPFFSLSGSDFVEMFVGVGASRVRDLFKQAKEKAPCIIFIDEIDAIGRARGKNPMTGANDERENTLNQLLTEMDGFGNNQGVIILAATNRADILDRALLRAGRFDRTIHVELPDIEERKAIFSVHLRPVKLGEGIQAEFLAKQTPGFSGADIANVCNEAALIAARKDKVTVDKQDFLDAIDRIVGGLEKRNKIISPHEKEVIAFHEAGHAAVSWLLRYASPLVKVTIVPRGKALGAAWYLPEERQITTFEQMFHEMIATLGGRASEEINFGKISTGALNDLERVTKQAFSMVVYFGLNDKIGNISYYDSTGQSEYSFTKPYSEQTSQIIDEEISKLVEKAYGEAKGILVANKENVALLAKVLLEKEVIFREDLEAIFGKRPFDEEKTEHEIPKVNNENVDFSANEATPEVPDSSNEQDTVLS